MGARRRREPRPSKGRHGPGPEQLSLGVLAGGVLSPQLSSPLLCPGPPVLQTGPGTETLPGADTAPARYFPALAACPGGSQARLRESSSAGTREGQGGAPSRHPDPEGRQLRAGPHEQTPHMKMEKSNVVWTHNINARTTLNPAPFDFLGSNDGCASTKKMAQSLTPWEPRFEAPLTS